jgi:hypothetical protein
MRTALRFVVVAGAVLVTAALGVTGTASAALSTVGYDVSYPQCGKALPYSPAFAIVGVNGGKATTANPCLQDQLVWAWKSTGVARPQPKAAVYLNTANPGEYISTVTTWPTSGSTPYGTCTATDTRTSTPTRACSWQYGWERAKNSVVSFFTPAATAAQVATTPATYTWWLDVENDNTWQAGDPTKPATVAEAKAQNRATLEGMTAYLASRGAAVGLYSTTTQWNAIIGPVPKTSNLAGRNSWLAGATTLSGAIANCAKPALTPGGHVALTQYVVNNLDRDHSCG